MDTKIYIFSLEYGNRKEEKNFIKDILRTFDEDTVVGCGIFVNNNPYNFEFLLYVSIAKDIEKFENFIKTKYNKKKRIFNYFTQDIIEKAFRRGYNIRTFIDERTVDMMISEEADDTFLFPDKEILNQRFGGETEVNKFQKVFLSHSSKDKKVIDQIFNEFQKSEISAWYDKYEIEAGDSITDKINEGLKNSDIGIICISNNFLNASSGWTKSELNYFIQRRMSSNSDKKFIILNLDVEHKDLPPLVQDYRYIDYQEADAIEQLIRVLKKQLNR